MLPRFILKPVRPTSRLPPARPRTVSSTRPRSFSDPRATTSRTATPTLPPAPTADLFRQISPRSVRADFHAVRLMRNATAVSSLPILPRQTNVPAPCPPCQAATAPTRTHLSHNGSLDSSLLCLTVQLFNQRLHEPVGRDCRSSRCVIRSLISLIVAEFAFVQYADASTVYVSVQPDGLPLTHLRSRSLKTASPISTSSLSWIAPVLWLTRRGFRPRVCVTICMHESHLRICQVRCQLLLPVEQCLIRHSCWSVHIQLDRCCSIPFEHLHDAQRSSLRHRLHGSLSRIDVYRNGHESCSHRHAHSLAVRYACCVCPSLI